MSVSAKTGTRKVSSVKPTPSGRATAARNQKARSERREDLERHLGMPWEEWVIKKRGQWRDVMQAIDRFGYGAAYVPDGGDLYEIQKAAARLNERMQEDWVSW